MQKYLKKNKHLLFIAISLVVLAGAYIFINMERKKDVVGYINGDDVTLQQANVRMQEIGGAELLEKKPGASFKDLDENSKNLVLREEAIHRILVKEARKANLISQSDLRKQLKIFQEQILKKKLLENIANGAISEDKLKAEYNSQSEKIKGQQEIFAEHILLPSEEEANKVRTMLGASTFEELAKKYSADKSTSENGGSLGVLYTGNMLKEFETSLSKLQAGEVSEPVKTQYGWHLLKLISKKKAIILPYDQVKNNLSVVVAKNAIAQYIEPKVKDIKVDLVKIVVAEPAKDTKAKEVKAKDSDKK